MRLGFFCAVLLLIIAAPAQEREFVPVLDRISRMVDPAATLQLDGLAELFLSVSEDRKAVEAYSRIQDPVFRIQHMARGVYRFPHSDALKLALQLQLENTPIEPRPGRVVDYWPVLIAARGYTVLDLPERAAEVLARLPAPEFAERGEPDHFARPNDHAAYSAAWVSVGSSFFRIGNTEQARKALDRALEFVRVIHTLGSSGSLVLPNRYVVLQSVTNQMIAQGDVDAAREIWESELDRARALDIAQMPRALTHVARVYYEMGLTQQARGIVTSEPGVGTVPLLLDLGEVDLAIRLASQLRWPAENLIHFEKRAAEGTMQAVVGAILRDHAGGQLQPLHLLRAAGRLVEMRREDDARSLLDVAMRSPRSTEDISTRLSNDFETARVLMMLGEVDRANAVVEAAGAGLDRMIQFGAMGGIRHYVAALALVGRIEQAEAIASDERFTGYHMLLTIAEQLVQGQKWEQLAAFITRHPNTVSPIARSHFHSITRHVGSDYATTVFFGAAPAEDIQSLTRTWVSYAKLDPRPRDGIDILSRVVSRMDGLDLGHRLQVAMDVVEVALAWQMSASQNAILAARILREL